MYINLRKTKGKSCITVKKRWRMNYQLYEDTMSITGERIFLKPLEVVAYRLSKDTEIPQTRISQIIKGKREITFDTAL